MIRKVLKRFRKQIVIATVLGTAAVFAYGVMNDIASLVFASMGYLLLFIYANRY